MWVNIPYMDDMRYGSGWGWFPQLSVFCFMPWLLLITSALSWANVASSFHVPPASGWLWGSLAYGDLVVVTGRSRKKGWRMHHDSKVQVFSHCDTVFLYSTSLLMNVILWRHMDLLFHLGCLWKTYCSLFIHLIIVDMIALSVMSMYVVFARVPWESKHIGYRGLLPQ